jgi:hypothetical protein
MLTKNTPPMATVVQSLNRYANWQVFRARDLSTEVI